MDVQAESQDATRVRLDGLDMHLRPSELASVAAGLGGVVPGAAAPPDPLDLVEAVRQLPANDRAPTWELAVRHFGRRAPLPRAAAEIGMDLIRAGQLIESLLDHLAGGQFLTRHA